MRSEPLQIPSASSLRAECNSLLLEKEKDFWMKKAELLHETLEDIWSMAEADGKIVLLRKGKTITLLVSPSHSETP